MSQNIFPIRGKLDGVKIGSLELKECYELLDVSPEASASEIKQAYWDLVKIWHPERFSDDKRLQEKARRKLEQISDAFNCIKAARPDFGPPVRQKATHPPVVESNVPGYPVLEEPPILKRSEFPALSRALGEPWRERPKGEVERTEYPGHDGNHRNILVKSFWGFVTGLMLAIPISGVFFLTFGGLAAAVSFNVTWIGVLVFALRRKP